MMEQINRLKRSVMNMLGIGHVTSSDDSGNVQLVQFKTPFDVRGDTPRLSEFGFASGLPVGTDVVLAHVAGDRSNAVIIATNNRAYRLAGLSPGESAIYDQWGHYVKLTESGIVVEAKSGPVTINNADTVTVNASSGMVFNTPTLKVSGDIIDNSDSGNATTLKNLRDSYNEHDHDVKEVESGSSTVTSEKTDAQVS